MTASSKAPPIRLGVNVLASGRHDAAWKTFSDKRSLPTDIDHFVAIAQAAERGLFDAIFLADGPGGLVSEAYTRPWRALDPIVLVAHLAAHTRHVGLVCTTTSLFGHPHTIARQIASIDHLSHGRAAWNVITSQNPPALAAYGVDQGWDQAQRYQRAEEFVQIVTQFWDSVPDEAVVADPHSGVYLDPSRLRQLDFQGTHFTARGALSVPRTPQGRPVIFQAGQSTDSKAFGARYADALFTGQRVIEAARAFYGDVKALAQGYGRNPDHLLVMPGLFPILGSTDEEAHRHKRRLDDLLDAQALRTLLAHHLAVDVDALADLDAPIPYAQTQANEHLVPVASRWHRNEMLKEARRNDWNIRDLLFSNITGGHRVYTGTPEGFAGDMIHWVDSKGADGFNLNIDVQPTGLDLIADEVIPVLQKHGRYRHAYEGRTLRDNLGLPRFVADAAHPLASAA
ncbi:NtaA/DmoA family FMN-dependent monooxygenase [Robbsia sp. Bb-Pol-6]|uniref:NtaA/DmoA family FMN-dependent monooxygenase n=1 Tax=Robbsia betulipollinis TaxID=2981849 RepID=A0ABT3ZJZ4_9BURK|nr:NtaA/DmoA family FMN-dependent monooxygenase [Robbsia betulipollinis]MCY0386610.1 NtaA/DmoA family FMN-dependent monooxygenase [Robbsia betulipollinis]